ncbi:MAG: HEAT repeat domain-containing protein [Gemmatimonadota bacterium]
MKRSLVERDFEGIEELAGGSRSVLGDLLALTYDPDPGVAWSAIEGTGVAAARIVRDQPEAVREHLRRLFWLLTEESGGIGWRAPETMAVVVRRLPERFGEYVPIVIHLLSEMAEEDLGHFRPGILWAIGWLGPLAEDVVDDVLPDIVASLDDPDPVVRGTAVWCLGRVGRKAALTDRPHLRHDGGALRLYDGRELRPTTVGRCVVEALGPTPVDPDEEPTGGSGPG